MDEGKEIELRSEEVQEVLGAVPSWILRWGITTLFLIVVILLIGSYFFKYPDTISSEMTLTGLNPPVAILAKTTGKLQELKVKDGETISKGDYLAVIENPANTDDIVSLKTYLAAFDENTIRLSPSKEWRLGDIQSVYESFYSALAEYRDFMELHYYPRKKTVITNKISKQEELSREMLKQKNIAKEQFEIIRNQHNRNTALHEKGVIAYEDLETSKNQYLQSQLSLENVQSTIVNMEMELILLKGELLDMENQYIERKNALELQLKSSFNQLQTELHNWEIRYALTAPINGKAIFTTIWTENQNIQAGQNVFNMVPESTGHLIGKALLPMSRSGKVKTGQKVNIRFDNFPDNEFGIVKAIVKNVSVVPVKENTGVYYVVDIELPDGLLTTYNKELPYLPEMKAQADIITDDFSLMERLIMPLKKVLYSSANHCSNKRRITNRA